MLVLFSKLGIVLLRKKEKNSEQTTVEDMTLGIRHPELVDPGTTSIFSSRKDMEETVWSLGPATSTNRNEDSPTASLGVLNTTSKQCTEANLIFNHTVRFQHGGKTHGPPCA